MSHDTARAFLDEHAEVCENNAAIQRQDGQIAEAANNEANAAAYRAASASLSKMDDDDFLKGVRACRVDGEACEACQ